MANKFVTKIRSLFSNENSGSTAILAFGRSVLLTSVVVTGLVVGVRQLGMLEGMELRAYDQLMRSRRDEGPDNRLLVVGVTESDIQSRGEYPIKDETLAQLLEKLQAYQPRAIGIDILRDVPQGTPQGRVALEKILKQNESIIAVCKMSSANEPGTAAAPGVPEERVGFADLPLDPGGTLRRSLLLSTPTAPKVTPPIEHLCNIPDPENQIPSFSFQLALLYLEDENIAPELTPNGELQIDSAVFNRLSERSGGYHNADAGDYRLMLNYRSPENSVKQVSLSEVLDGKIEPAWVKDRIVLIGYTSANVKDDFYTPYSVGAQDSQKMPGVVVHAQNVSQILSTVLDERPLIWYWPEGNEILWVLGWSLVGGILAWRVRRLWLFGLGGVVAAGVLYGTCYMLFIKSAGWVPLIPPMVGLVATAVTVVLIERGYAKAIYQGVKKVILNIEIDEEKKQKDVAAITETESFTELQQKAAQLRKNRRKDKASDVSAEVTSEDAYVTEDVTPTSQKVEPSEIKMNEAVQAPQEADLAQEDDYLQQLQKRGKRLKAEAVTPTPQDTESLEPEEDDYFQQLQKRGKRLKKTEDESNR
ncbi:MAG TPA: CHASE2 domain-containing protein [Coleofasciculaceae cyanobacterium]